MIPSPLLFLRFGLEEHPPKILQTILKKEKKHQFFGAISFVINVFPFGPWKKFTKFFRAIKRKPHQIFLARNLSRSKFVSYEIFPPPVSSLLPMQCSGKRRSSAERSEPGTQRYMGRYLLSKLCAMRFFFDRLPSGLSKYQEKLPNCSHQTK